MELLQPTGDLSQLPRVMPSAVSSPSPVALLTENSCSFSNTWDCTSLSEMPWPALLWDSYRIPAHPLSAFTPRTLLRPLLTSLSLPEPAVPQGQEPCFMHLF